MKFASILGCCLLLSSLASAQYISGGYVPGGVFGGGFTGGCTGGGPPFYICSLNTNSNTGLLTSYFTNSSVQNATTNDPTLGGGNCITLATDSTSEPNGKSMQGSFSDSANDLMWSEPFFIAGVKTWYLAATNIDAGISLYEVQINPSTNCAQIIHPGAPAWSGLSGPFAWNWTGIGDVRTFYHMRLGHILESYTVTDITSVGSPTTLIDFLFSGSCPGSGLPGTGHGNWNSELTPAVFNGNLRFSLAIGTSGQGSAVWVFSYDTGLGCYTANMQTGKWYQFCNTGSCGSVAAQNFSTTGHYCYGAPGGATDNIHDGRAPMDGTVFRMSEVDSPLSPWTVGICNGNTSNAQDIALYIGTGNTDYTNEETNGGAKCPGINCQFDNHPSEGNSNVVAAIFLGYNRRPVSSYSGPFTSIAPPLSSFTSLGITDSHGFWPPTSGDTFPTYLLETDSNTSSQFFGCTPNAAQCPSYLANEILALPIDGSNAAPRRIVHTHSSNNAPYAPSNAGNDAYFGPGNSNLSCSPDGILCSWATSDFGAFGTDSGGQLHSRIAIVVPN